MNEPKTEFEIEELNRKISDGLPNIRDADLIFPSSR
jgi:hypothetical protein